MQVTTSKIIIDKLPGEEVHKQLDIISNEVKDAIRKMIHPKNSNNFKINPKPKTSPSGKTNKHPNGVNFLKFAFAKNILHDKEWYAEDPDFLPNKLYEDVCKLKKLPKIWGSRYNKQKTVNKQYRVLFPTKVDLIEEAEKKGWGKIDFLRKVTINNEKRTFAVEWDTGNVSSAHRAINKLISAIYFSDVIGGIVIVPMKGFAKFLTDRVSNYEEIVPYFPLFALQECHQKFQYGYLEIIGILHDEEDEIVDYLPKGKDGNSLINKGLL